MPTYAPLPIIALVLINAQCPISASSSTISGAPRCDPGAILADKSLVTIKDCYDTQEVIETGIKKVGAMLGDYAEIGCNSVLNPGTVVGKNSNVYPLSSVRGVIPANHIYKDKEHVVVKN